MSYSGQQTYRAAVIAAEATRQQSVAAAKVTYAFNPSNYAAYVIAIGDADAAYQAAVATAAAALNETPGGLGMNGPIPGAGWTPLTSMA